MNNRILTVILLLMTSCSDIRQPDDLYEKMADWRNLPQSHIEPLPRFMEVQRYRYSNLGMRSPFVPPMVMIGDERVTGNAVSEPNHSRPKEALELFNYSALSMVGSLAKGDRIWALIDDGNGRIHRVSTGNYLGRNFGKIIGIDNIELDVLEIVPDGKRGWVSRPRTLVITQ
ncbi:pilus assembly protein PilP [SAR92 clade bacterium H921]|nr:pilus assembly protein PilP [SAR92 clade bacterium H921]MDG0972107.1 pilus assembly protein PilP [Porticoccaceae bacterium]MDG1308524.1 pilus assembly protein PilP [Porticoccaceae bacterium]